jgi:hypothetical protein
VAVGRVAEVPGQRVGCGQPVEPAEVARLVARLDDGEEVEVGPGVQALRFQADRPEADQRQRMATVAQGVADVVEAVEQSVHDAILALSWGVAAQAVR